MIKRSIIIFPEFENGFIIDEIRKKYDSAVNHIRPHVSLVFPFESEIATEELKRHVLNAVRHKEAFDICLKGVVRQKLTPSFLFLNIVEGDKDVIELHKKLYTGILAEFLPDFLNVYDFWPHLTIGNIKNEEAFQAAYDDIKDMDETFKTKITEIAVEIIDENEDSIIEFVIKLK